MYGYELDFLPVEAAGGGGTKSGDAIAGRLWLPDGSCRVIVVDGGHSAIGEDLIDHIDTYYGTYTVDIVVSTHPDNDHLNGLLRVVEQMRVGELLIHQPRNHLAPADVAYFTNIAMVDAVIDAAESRGVTVAEPFTGLTRWGGQLRVLGPTEEFYEYLIGEHIREERSSPGAAAARAAAKAYSAVRSAGLDVLSRTLPFLPVETLEENPQTSHRNNSSAVLLLRSADDHRILLTGDAGVSALSLAAAEYERLFGSFFSQPLNVFQLPHHGSRNNVSPSLLDRIIGSIGSVDTVSAVISSAKASPHHPSPKVTNAALRRGAHVVATEGRTVCAYAGLPRPGWAPVPGVRPLDEDD
ncbi:hypothetical protein [Mycobacterium sp.]|uniref:ComEC/Rec2 family competence protein n=1 Tax=Mycobacterium sp. TaxID=1785 RepID=UPI00261B4DFF|nr:hypothetical protein [Mycobacterium sp.]